MTAETVRMMVETVAICLGVILIIALWAAARWLVWHIPAYGRFKNSIEALEKLSVERVHGMEFAPPISLKSLGERRVNELAAVSGANGDFTMRLVRCYGAMYIKDESIEDAIKRIQVSCLIAVSALILGLLWYVGTDVEFQKELAEVSAWDVVPHIFERLRSGEAVIIAEILSVVLGLFAIVDAGRHVKKLHEEAHL